MASLHAELAPLRVRRSATPSTRATASSPPAEATLPAPRLAFAFVSALPPLAGHTAARPVAVLENAFRVSFRGLEYHVSPLADGADARQYSRFTSHPRGEGDPVAAFPPLHVALCPTDQRRRDRLSVALQRVRDPGFLSVDERIARGFMYDVFDYISQLAQLRLGQSYIHASVVERDGEGAAIVAWSGVGKTAALLKLVAEHDFRYLSDDIALVDDSGTLWRTPKLIQLKAINVEGEDRLRSMLLQRRSPLDRFSWMQRRWRHGPKGVRRRVSAEQLFGAKSMARNAPLKRVFCVERADVADVEVSEISTGELIRRSATVVMDLMEPFSFLSYAIRSSHHTPILPSHVQVWEETNAVLARAFRSVPVLNVRIPLAARPGELSDYLVRLIEGSRAKRGRSVAAG